ncbi:nucleotidyltransferase family protein [Cryobacterium sp. TMT2-18-3]|uniref:nucleotidyltransferase family protein n=1 Tax=unclassified Cryobacterium TaxID=2649013 RepID=UPI00106B41F8|nr:MULTISPECIES: nucleotidyltransferase family protein [unclassified Cryobacterium]TFC25668.1 nucleotidyltransferase family protein [Cryobacterium sp. TMT2-18-2]TFC36791.1 nucleotidyltransferase family protein [Cryobacterium sp. TMT2-42-4]TFC65543.1 nucleotidyltransferase family protein [Cryobacterium sp. TMT2-18-3]
MATSSAPIAGLVLAAGAGSRYGMPKALARGNDGIPWLVRTIRTLTDAGCSPVIVVIGAETAEVRALLHQFGMTPSVVLTQAEDWAEGLSASLRAGLRQATELQATELLPAPVAVAIVPVDIPGLLPGTVARLIGTLPTNTLPTITLPGDTDADANPVGPLTLRQAGFDARPGHPVVIGRAHWGALIDSATGDTGARPYLQSHDTRLVDCADLETGLDVDTRD